MASAQVLDADDSNSLSVAELAVGLRKLNVRHCGGCRTQDLLLDKRPTQRAYMRLCPCPCLCPGDGGRGGDRGGYNSSSLYVFLSCRVRRWIRYCACMHPPLCL